MEPDDDKTQTHIALTKGTMVSHYRIVKKIGAGGMGEVYLAQDTELDRKVALKFLPQHLCQDEDCRKRFKREAQAAAKLSHPNIIHVYEVSDYQGRPFFAMEHVEGRSLREYASSEAMPIERVLEVGIQICGGLHAAHEKGVTHRDIKPSNILIDSYGRARIVDFGLASVRDADQLTKTGSTLGTVGYMSPEQVRGKEVDHRSDLFSTGVVLYELITKQNPFRRETEAATLKAVSDDHPEPLARFKRDIPEGMQAIVDKALEKDVQTRYQHADGMLADLIKLKRVSDSTESTRITSGLSGRLLNRRWAAFIFIILSVLVLIFQPWNFRIENTQEAVASENRLLITCFDNLADLSDSLKQGEIIASLLISDLGNSDYIQVVSLQRLFDIQKLLGHEKDRAIDLSVSSEIARRVGASRILNGSILQTEPTFLVTYQLVNASDGDVIASGRVAGEKDHSIFDVTDQLTVAVKEQLQLPGEALTENDPDVSQITTNSTEAYRLYLRGLRQEDELKYDSAAVSFRQAISIDSNFVMAYFRLSIVGGSRRERLDAIESAHNCLDRASQRERILVRAGYAALVEHDLEAARELMESLLEKKPDDKWATFSLGVIYRDNFRDLDRSKYYLHETIKLDSNYKLAYCHLAYIYADLGLEDSAYWAINEYIKKAPGEPNPHDTQGDLYRYRGELSKAIAAYEKVLRIDSTFRLTKTKLADTYLFLGDLKKADSVNLELATSGSKTERAQHRLRLTLSLEYQGKIREALRKINLLIETDKMEKGTRGWILAKVLKKALLYDILGETDSSIYYIEEMCNGVIDSLGYDVQAWLAYYYYRVGENAKADRIGSQLIVSRDSLISSGEIGAGETALLAFVEYSRGNYERAINLIDEAREVVQGGSDFQWFPLEYFKALTLYDMGNLGGAVDQFRVALNCYDLDRAYHITRAVLTHYRLGRTYEESGWNQEAIEQYEKFLDIWKDADRDIKEVEDARARLMQLRAGS